MVGPSSLMKIRRVALLLAALAGAGVAVYSVVDYLAYDEGREEESLAVGRAAGIRVAEALDATLFEIRLAEDTRDFAGSDLELQLRSGSKAATAAFSQCTPAGITEAIVRTV